jgi:rabenosyn-5
MPPTALVTNRFSSDERPTAEASAARKRLLDAFAQYDALAKRIRALPTSGPGSSQDRVLAAVHSRANIFLQKHMFPLQVSTRSDA